ncbi:hypothetical protein M0R72_16090 [Candidatus Pacearchaeota archaeon]|jgi:hypothetical protein|nr:hypothetical protein [Candidatus Pacearchaeota archaeon]
MEKEALLTYGLPRDEEDKNFSKFIETNLKIMKEIALHKGYNVRVEPVLSINPLFEEYNKTKDFLFYYTGHATFFKNVEIPFLEKFPLNLLVKSIEKLPAKKIILLDACSDNFIENYIPAENTSIAGAFNMPYNSTLAMSIYDAVNCRGKKLEDLSQETFNEMKHNWIKFKKNWGVVQYA